ncbi:hypothetical protein [Sangeribacter muris]|uniref:hypothetical protein n=1 Tax=Sangeribacter muris TaxID=2880703 RepID=UPI00244E2643|nr:hypothetical protein [Sangeribacter muris]
MSAKIQLSFGVRQYAIADGCTCNIVVSKPELSEEDKANLKEKAMEQYKEEQLRELRKQSQRTAVRNSVLTNIGLLMYFCV